MTVEERTRTCEICKGTMVQELQDYTVEADDDQILVEDVPVWVCEQCGFTEVEEEVIEAIEDMIAHMDTVLEDQADEGAQEGEE